jgi:hypothetical protein
MVWVHIIPLEKLMVTLLYLILAGIKLNHASSKTKIINTTIDLKEINRVRKRVPSIYND